MHDITIISVGRTHPQAALIITSTVLIRPNTMLYPLAIPTCQLASNGSRKSIKIHGPLVMREHVERALTFVTFHRVSSSRKQRDL